MKHALLKFGLLVFCFSIIITPVFAAGDDTCCDGGMVCNECTSDSKNAKLTRGQPEEPEQVKSSATPSMEDKPAQTTKKAKKKKLVKRCDSYCN